MDLVAFLSYIALMTMLNVIVILNAKISFRSYFDQYNDGTESLKLWDKFLFCVVSPVFEGLVFRYYLRNMGMVGSSVFYGLCHLSNYYYIRNIWLVLYQIALCCILGCVFYSFDGLEMSIFAHTYYNTLMLEVTLAQNRRQNKENREKCNKI